MYNNPRMYRSLKGTSSLAPLVVLVAVVTTLQTLTLAQSYLMGRVAQMHLGLRELLLDLRRSMAFKKDASNAPVNQSPAFGPSFRWPIEAITFLSFE